MSLVITHKWQPVGTVMSPLPYWKWPLCTGPGHYHHRKYTVTNHTIIDSIHSHNQPNNWLYLTIVMFLASLGNFLFMIKLTLFLWRISWRWETYSEYLWPSWVRLATWFHSNFCNTRKKAYLKMDTRCHHLVVTFYMTFCKVKICIQ